MDFFDNLILPQSSEHIQLLHYLLILIQFLFLPFLSVILVGTFLSLKYLKKGVKEKNYLCLDFSKDVIDTLAVNKSFGTVLGILPLLASVLIYAQLLHKSNSSAMVILLTAALLIIFGIIFIYIFKSSLDFPKPSVDLNNESLLDQSAINQKVKFEGRGNKLSVISGIISLVLIFVGAWYYISAISSAVLNEYWESGNQLIIILSAQSILNFVQFLLLASAIGGSAILFAFFFWEGGKQNLSDEYKNLVKKISGTISLIALILLPILFLVNLILLPKSALSGSVFFYYMIAVILIFLAYHLLYAILRTSNLKMSGQLFFVVIFTVLALIIKDQISMSNSTKFHSAILNSDFEKYLSELKGVNTLAVQVRSGEEIYQIVCSTCHKFDEKLVGPPYNKVLTKYEGKMDQLVEFIKNPAKVDPAYPPMPNLALKTAEARNIAEYLMNQHSQNSQSK